MRQGLLVSLLHFAVATLFWGCTARPAPTAIRVRWPHDPETLDPLQLVNQQAIDIINLTHVSLLLVDAETSRFAPALAATLPTKALVGDSLTQLTYHLRPAATWDDGRPVTAQDVAFTLKLMHCPGLPNEGTHAQTAFIRAIRLWPADDRALTLTCRGQAPEYAQASGDFPILCEAALDPTGLLRRFSLAELQDRPATAVPDSALNIIVRRYLAATSGRFPGLLPGCGPYQLTDWQKNRRLTLRRKPQWWADRLRPIPFVLQARPAQLRFEVIPNDATATLALQRGALDVYPQVPAREFARLRRARSRPPLAFYTAASYDVVTAGFNTQQAALADAATRRALSYLFDAAGLLQATQQGEGQRTVGLIHPTDRRNYNQQLAPLPFDTAAAVAQLRQAGWRRGSPSGTGWQRLWPGHPPQRLQLRLRYRADETTFATVALQFRSAAGRLGIPVTLLPTEQGGLTTALRAGDFDLYVRTLKGNPFIFNFKPILHSAGAGAGNVTGFSTPASDRLIEAIAAADNPAQKARLLRQFQTMLQREAPLVPLFFLPTRIAAGADVRNLHVSGLKPGYVVAAASRQVPSPTAP